MVENHNLEKCWSDWRREMQRAVGTPDRLLELECHLRDAMDHVMASGMDELSAFRFCSRKLGSPEEFAMQYPQPMTKANWIALWSVRMLWLLGFFVAGFYLFRQPRLSTVHVFALLLGYWTLLCSMALGLWILFGFKEPVAGEKTGPVFKKQMTMLFGVSTLAFTLGTWLGMIWSRENLGVYWDNEPKELVCLVITLASGGCWILCWSQDLSPRRMASLALLAFVVMIWCYCLPVYWVLSNLDHGYAGNSRWYLEGAMVVLTLIFSGMALTGFLPRKRPAPDPTSRPA